MKKLVLVLLFCLITSFAFAQEIKAKVVGVDVGDRDYIWIGIEYSMPDGSKINNAYPMDFKNVVGKTNQEILQWIKVNVDFQIDRYIEAEFRKKVNLDIIQNKLSTFIGREYIRDTATLQFDTNNDGQADYEWDVKTTGEYVEKTITP